MSRKRKQHSPVCSYCRKPSQLVTGRQIYPHRSDLWEKPFYRCVPCDAYVGCHPGGTVPLGRLANAELRAAKSRAHAAFDPLWRAKMQQGLNRQHSRSRAYQWLADQMKLPAHACHIGHFDVEQCDRVVAICKPFERAARARLAESAA